MRAIRNLLLALVLGSLAFLGLRAVFRALASPETKIRWRMEEMVEGFNAMRARPVFDGIAKDFVDHSAGITRDDLHATLAWLFLNELDAKGEFLWNAVFDRAGTTIEVAPDKRSAEVLCHMQIFRRRGERPELEWDARVAGTFALGDDGWKWSVVSSANHSERR